MQPLKPSWPWHDINSPYKVNHFWGAAGKFEAPRGRALDSTIFRKVNKQTPEGGDEFVCYLCSVDEHPLPIVPLLVKLEVGIRLAKKVLKSTGAESDNRFTIELTCLCNVSDRQSQTPTFLSNRLPHMFRVIILLSESSWAVIWNRNKAESVYIL